MIVFGSVFHRRTSHQLAKVLAKVRWSSYLWQQDSEQELLPLVDTSVQTAEDLVRWFRRNEQLLGAV